jgi:hypothetical protein
MESPTQYLYLAPNSKNLQTISQESHPIPEGCVRVVCISDTHNQHDLINLPWGHILVHAGDILTESRIRYVQRANGIEINPIGTQLLQNFSHWLGTLPHPHKVIIGGNHDGVLDALGPDVVRKILYAECAPGSCVYLVHEEATVGSVKVFGSPYGHWGSHNDAFLNRNISYDDISKDTHIVVTHSPVILPKRKGLREVDSLVNKMVEAGTLLNVSGHCHWAYGLYHTSKQSIPCVVVSICDSHWLSRYDKSLFSAKRGDEYGDSRYGGYNIKNLPIVCDIAVPGGPPRPDAIWLIKGNQIVPESKIDDQPKTKEKKKKGNHIVEESKIDDQPKTKEKEKKSRTLLFFGPPTDPAAVTRLMPVFSKNFVVDHFEEASVAVVELQKKTEPYTVCVAKLGSKGNLGKTVMKAIREKHGNSTFIIVHSATASGNVETQKSLKQSVGVDLFVDHKTEARLAVVLKDIANKQ